MSCAANKLVYRYSSVLSVYTPIVILLSLLRTCTSKSPQSEWLADFVLVINLSSLLWFIITIIIKKTDEVLFSHRLSCQADSVVLLSVRSWPFIHVKVSLSVGERWCKCEQCLYKVAQSLMSYYKCRCFASLVKYLKIRNLSVELERSSITISFFLASNLFSTVEDYWGHISC